MAKYAKWIGGGLGWVLGGPIGAIMGFALGAVFDGMQNYKSPYEQSGSEDFKVSLLVLSAAVMKADDRLMRSELEYVKAFLFKQFEKAEAEQKLLLFKEILKQNIPLRDVCLQIRSNMDFHSRLQLMHFLFGIAAADGHFHGNEVKVLSKISYYLGVSSKDFDSIKAMFVKDVDSAYKILEISPDASIEEIKKAYRRMAVKYHPDKVAHLETNLQNAAKEKFQELNNAYEQIKKQKGFN